MDVPAVPQLHVESTPNRLFQAIFTNSIRNRQYT